MKVILVTEGYPPVIGGLEKVVAEIAHRLLNNGFDVSVVTIAADDKAAFELDDNIRLYRLPIKKIGSGGESVKSILFMIKSVFLMLKILVKEKPDVVNIHYIGYLSFVFYIVNTVLGIPYIASIHGSDIEKTEQQVSRQKKTIIKKILEGSKFVFSNSDALLIEAEKITGSNLIHKSAIIANGINLNNYKNTFSPEVRDTIVGIGRFAHKKGLDLLIKAFYEVQKANKQTRLILAGDGPEFENCQEICKHLGIEEKVTFLGFVYNENIKSLFEKASVFVLPSRKEAFGVILLEAMASGVPIIAAKTGGVPGIIKDGVNGILVPPENPQSMAQAILLLLKRRDMRIKYSANGLENVKKYDWENIIKEYERYYGLCK